MSGTRSGEMGSGGQRCTRLAPSPTGALHLGNARTFLITWALARQMGWRVVLRIEDLDTPRVKPGVIDLTIDLLAWLGMDWDEGPTVQSADLGAYRDAMRTLAGRGMTYPSAASRGVAGTGIGGGALGDEGASAPQQGAQEAFFGREHRPSEMPGEFGAGLMGFGSEGHAEAWRFATPNDEVVFDDAFAGAQRWTPSATVGDFIIWTKRNQPAYQLAVVVDDFRQGVTDVVRGDDLLDSAARQLLLYRALSYAPEPTYWHVPLVVGEDGRRLAKRHGDTRLDVYRARGVRAERVIGLVAHWCGVIGERRELSAAEFLAGLRMVSIPRDPITFRREDDQWLLG